MRLKYKNDNLKKGLRYTERIDSYERKRCETRQREKKRKKK